MVKCIAFVRYPLSRINRAIKLAPQKIRVNAIAPGLFQTDMMAHMEKPEMKAIYDIAVGMIPLQRIGGIDDMKGVAVFLSSEASAYMTGAVLVVDGSSTAK